ncbi:MAG: type II secretion system protein GspK [Xanthobacteraceae bacterium]|jgi:general secretion pathway protein K
MARSDRLTRNRREYSLRLSKLFVARSEPARGDDGFIVVAVLWILGILAALISIYAIYVANAAVSLSVNDDRVQAEALVSAALELTAYQLTAVDEKSRPTTGDFAFRMGRADVAVEFRSEAARIDLNAAPKELLAGLFAALGARYDDAEYYADRIIGWRSKGEPDSQAQETEAYRTAGLSYAPRQAPFANVGELWLVLGLPPALVERALPFVTVFSGMPTVNVLDARPEVVAALPGMSAELLYAVLSQRGTGPQNAQFVLGLLGPAQGAATADGSKATRVTVRIGFVNGRRVGAEAVILPVADADEPFDILSWRDDFDGPS